jgi:Periplasmic protease
MLWARAYPVADFEKPLIAPYDPRTPTLVKRGKTVVISIPSHDPSHQQEFDSLISSHTTDLQNASHIIVDLRGNEGGSSGMTNALLPYIVTKEKRRTKYTTDYGEAVILSSPDQIAYAHWGFGSDTTEFAKSLIRRMTGHLGEMVPLRDPAKPADQDEPDSVIDGNWKVGVLVDRGTVSASEVMVLKALRSKRATVFGQPTQGALDYQSTRIVWFSPKERRWGLGYPTITSHAMLPVGGMRGKGIEPDVRLDLKRLSDPIATVDALLDNK